MSLTLLKFYKVDCPPCKKMSPITKELAEEFQDIDFIGIDVEKQADLAKKYEVRSVPTIILERNGNIVARLVGLATKKELQEHINLLFE